MSDPLDSLNSALRGRYVLERRGAALSTRHFRGQMIMLEIANNLISAHISQFPVGTYKKAHRHGPGAHVFVLEGEGFSLFWKGDSDIERHDWGAGSLMVPPEGWFHQHFNVGKEPARYLALKPFSSRKFPGLKKQFGTSESVKTGGDQIEYEDEDPRIRAWFEEELQKRGVKSGMDQVTGVRYRVAGVRDSKPVISG